MKHTALIALTLILGACTSQLAPDGPYQPVSENLRSALIAEERNLEAADLIYTDPAEAERLLREALTADIYFGPAHNNLGVLYLEQGKLFEAANEFEWARKLMPGAPDPRMNLALTLEVAGRAEEAIAEYRSALETAPGHVPTMQSLARLLVAENRSDEQLPLLLKGVALHAIDSNRRRWALKLLSASRGADEDR